LRSRQKRSFSAGICSRARVRPSRSRDMPHRSHMRWPSSR
jgi:hypothetical protein